VALAHSLLTIMYHVLRTGQAYQDLGPDYFDRRREDQLTRHLVKRLESLGHKVSLEPGKRVG
jgi:hypothetical protein